MTETPDDTFQKIGIAALRVAMQAQNQLLARKLFGPVPTDDDLRALYPKPTPAAGQGEAA